MTETYVIYGLRLSGSTEYRYIGLTTATLKKRLSGHKSQAFTKKSRLAVHCWMRKHGPDLILGEVMEYCPIDDLPYLNYAEKYWIQSLKEFGHRLLNHTDGGEGVLGLPAWNKGLPMSEDHKRMLRNIHLGSNHTEEQRHAISKGVRKHFEKNGHKPVYDFWVDSYGKDLADILREEKRKKASSSLSGTGNPMYGKSGQDAPCYGRVGSAHPMYGTHHTDEAKERISKATKGRPKSEITKIRMSFANHIRHHSSNAKESCRWCSGDSLDVVISVKEKELDGVVE